MEKIFKTLESLKVPSLSSHSDSNIPGTITSAVAAASDAVKTKKKERISHCIAVTDAVCTPAVQNLTDFPQLMESVTEVLFQLCNDTDSDIRLVASDCLNRMVRTLKDHLSHRLQMEVYKEIKRNQSPRALRTALSLFAFMSPYIRPQKCRVFIQTLLPCFSQIAKRTEELLYENLATSFLQIFKNLGKYLNDVEIKLLFREYLQNLESSSAIVRRSSASILVYICQYSRKPNVFLPRLLSHVTELLMPNLMEKSVPVIIGVLLCVRQCINPLFEQMRNIHQSQAVVEPGSVVKYLIQVYEMCLILCNHDDHNVITTSLDTLQQLLASPIDQVAQCLTSKDGIKNSFNAEEWTPRVVDSGITIRDTSSQSQWLPSFGGSTDDPAALLLEAESFPDVPKFRSMTSSTVSEGKEEFDIDVSIASSRRNSDVFMMATASEDEPGSHNSGDMLPESGDDADPYQSNTDNNVVIESYPELQIGSLYEENIPMYYCTRFLAYNFLLAGRKGYQRPDSEIRVTVKVLAINCIINAVKLCPQIINLPLSTAIPASGDESPDELQTVEDVCLYASHHDPLLRGSLYSLVSHLVHRVLEVHQGSFKEFPISLEKLVTILKRGLQDLSNVGVKYAISAVQKCIVSLWRSETGSKLATELFSNLFDCVSNPYWLIKVDLVDLLSSIEWDAVENREQAESQVRSLLLEFLRDEDIRVRSASVTALVKLIQMSGKSEDWSIGKLQVFSHVAVIRAIGHDVFELSNAESVNPKTASTLGNVLNIITTLLVDLEEKNSTAGVYAALAELSKHFPPKNYRRAWRCGSTEIPTLLALSVDMLRSSPIVKDLFIHQNILTLAHNLFLGVVTDNEALREPDSSLPFDGASASLTTYGLQLLHHSYEVVKLYHSTIEAASPAVQKKTLPSPVVSPVKKSSSKEIPEKKDTDADKKIKQLDRKQSQNLSPHKTYNACPVQLKRISEALRQSWKIYRSNLDPVVTHKFTCVLDVALSTLGHICSSLRPDYVGLPSMVDDILVISPTLFHVSPIPTIKCIRKILRCLSSHTPAAVVDESYLITVDDPVKRFQEFSENFYKSLIASRKGGVFQTSSDKTTLTSYIRSFEPIVITALRVYTISSDVGVQVETLSLLSDLIKARVNYTMVDPSQAFLSFVIKQMGYLEEGHVREPTNLLKAIFNFFALLSHEQLSIRKAGQFIDVPKMLRLCDGLVASGQNPDTHCIPALWRVVYDLFIRRGFSGVTNLEKKDLEAQREVLFQIIIKLANVPEILPVLLVLVQGRRATNETKWATESATIASTLVYAVEKGQLLIRDSIQFQCLSAILFSINSNAVPPFERLRLLLEDAANTKVENIANFMTWTVQVNTFWLMMLRSSVCNNEGCVSGVLTLALLRKFVADLKIILTQEVVIDNRHKQFCVEQLVAFFQMTVYLLRQDIGREIMPQVITQEQREVLTEITNNVTEISILHPAIRVNFIDILTVLNYPYIQVWNCAVKSWQSEEIRRPFTSNLVASVMKQLLCAFIISYFHKVSSLFGIRVAEFRSIDFEGKDQHPDLEAWLIENYSEFIMRRIDSGVVTSFLNKISDNSRDLLMKKLCSIDPVKLNPFQIKSILSLLERLYQNYKPESILLCIKLLSLQNIPFISFEVAQFTCFLLTQVQGVSPITFPEESNKTLRKFVGAAANSQRYPRLVSMIERSIMTDNLENAETYGASNSIEVSSKTKDDLILKWCCDELNSVEGIALAKMLSSLTYTQIMNIFIQPTFNLSLLKHIFRHLNMQLMSEKLSIENGFNLLIRTHYTVLMEELPLGVAAFDFIVETLNGWEAVIPEDMEHLDMVANEEINEAILSIPFLNKLIHMWEALTELLKFKNAVIKAETSKELVVSNNYIPTRLFVLSFQYVRVVCARKDEALDIPLNQLIGFLNFASVALCDSSFLHFFNVRYPAHQIFTCVFSLGSVLRRIISKFKITYISTKPVETWSDLDAVCTNVLKEFCFLTDFINQARLGKISIDLRLLESLKSVVAGLARCELVNGWILVSHLDWKPPVTIKFSSQVFPPIQHIPLEILQNEKDLLQGYIFKLNFYGIASKIQFEENWMTFLSVINSYGDDHYQLPVIITGLQALTMMLARSVQIVYQPEDEALLNGAKGLKHIEDVVKDLEPEVCQHHPMPLLLSKCKKTLVNPFNVDVTSCSRFLIDLFTQWLQNLQEKLPLLLISKVVESIVVISEYFDDVSQYIWMYYTLVEIYKSCEKEDEVLWPHLTYGIFAAAAKVPLESEMVTNLVQILEGSITSTSVNVANTSLLSALVFLQSNPDCQPIINVVQPYLLTNSQLNETLSDTESHCYNVWKLLLFNWTYGPSDGVGGVSFENEVIGNILTVLSPLNKVYVSVRLLVLQCLKTRVRLGGLKPDTKKKISKVALETLRTPNMALFFESVKLFLTVFYCDFFEFYQVPDIDPELFMQMAERSEVLFKLLRRGRVFNCQVISRILPVVLMDFLPPSEILNRVIAEFLSPNQTYPELVAPTVAQIFEKARRKPKEAALVREWISASLPNFVATPDLSRTMWNLTLFFIGVSTTPEVANLLPFAELKRNPDQTRKLFIHSALDYYSTLGEAEKDYFQNIFRKGPFEPEERNPYGFLLDLIQDLDRQLCQVKTELCDR